MNTSETRSLIFSALLAMAICPFAQAGVYKCLDAQQRTVYRDTPCQDLTTARLPPHLAQPGQQTAQRHFLWKATSDSTKGTAYLLGSMHFGRQDMYPLPARIMDGFNASDVLIVEANLHGRDGGETAKKLAGTGTYTDGSNLEQHVKPGTWRKLLDLAQKAGIAEETLRPMKPWLAAMSLSNQTLNKSGFSEELGIEASFLRDAGTKKPILEMESVDEQIKLLDGLPAQEQEQFLLQGLQDAGRGTEIFTEIADAWNKGDPEAMDLIVRRTFDTSPSSAALYKKLFADRNEAMANKFDELLADGRTYFIIVGAAHLGGDQGLLKLLEHKGYRLEQQ